MLLFFVACSEYGFHPSTDVPEPVGSDPWVDTGAYDEPEPEPEPEATCELFPVDWAWEGSELLWSLDEVGGTYTGIELPDAHQVPAGADRAYRSTFSLEEVPPFVEVDLQSDDGIWLWVNGVEVGHWGGDFQQEGCVNDQANCLEYVVIEPVDITPHLVEGDNLVEARVSNAIEGSWFDLVPACVD